MDFEGRFVCLTYEMQMNRDLQGITTSLSPIDDLDEVLT